MKKVISFFVLLLFLLFACNNDGPKEQENNDTIIEKIEDANNKAESAGNEEAKEIVEPEVKPSLKQENEKIVFSFNTKNGKTMNILFHNEEKYLVYRFGTDDKIELQFPEKLENTFERFTYRYYFRGGGAMNMGLDLNYLNFKGETH